MAGHSILEMKKGGSRYPELLSQTAGAPETLFCLGAPPRSDEITVAVVGTRKATAEGRLWAKRIAAALARAGVTVASGLALGIDGAAHEGALEGGGRTLAVLARGLDDVYPQAHAGLARKIVEQGGAILSEYPVGTPPLQHQFLERNRIIAGLAVGTVIVEAPIHSGALVTARCAAEAGREVYVLPGPAGNPNYAGSHLLIRNGARLVASAEDILEDLVSVLPNYGLALPDGKAFVAEPEDDTDRAIFRALAEASGALTIDNLARLVNLETHIVSERLTYLILRDLVTENGGRYSLKR
jgi:DNA processing protein